MVAVESDGRARVVYRDIPEELRKAIEPVVGEHSLELMDVQTVRDRGQAILRVTLDTTSGDGRIPVDHLARASREIESSLDAADVMETAYRLEVSSPGLDRMLAREKDFTAACGSGIRLTTRRPLDGRRRFSGRLVAYANRTARVNIDGKDVEIPFDEIEKANSVYAFSSADFQIDSSA